MGPRLRGDDNEERALPPPDEGDAAPPSPDPSPPPADLAGGGESTPAAATDAAGAGADLSNLAPDARLARLSEMARVIDFQLMLLRHKQAHPQRGEDTKAINADVKNFAATAALIEHQLQKLEGDRSIADDLAGACSRINAVLSGGALKKNAERSPDRAI
jgi:hypothetical protein